MDRNDKYQSLFIIWHNGPSVLSQEQRPEGRKEGFSKPVQKKECHIGYSVGCGILQAELNGGCQCELKNLRQIVRMVYLCTQHEENGGEDEGTGAHTGRVEEKCPFSSHLQERILVEESGSMAQSDRSAFNLLLYIIQITKRLSSQGMTLLILSCWQGAVHHGWQGWIQSEGITGFGVGIAKEYRQSLPTCQRESSNPPSAKPSQIRSCICSQFIQKILAYSKLVSLYVYIHKGNLT